MLGIQTCTLVQLHLFLVKFNLIQKNKNEKQKTNQKQNGEKARGSHSSSPLPIKFQLLPHSTVYWLCGRWQAWTKAEMKTLACRFRDRSLPRL